MRRRIAVAWLICALGAACAEEPDSPEAPTEEQTSVPVDPAQPPTARWETFETLREDLTAPRHPSDGGGRAWLEGDSTGPVAASGTGRWTIVYEAGPLGVAVNGMVFLQVSPFWHWSTPQVDVLELPGFTEVSTEAAGVELEPETLGDQLLGIRIAGRKLEAGERIRIVYGAGEAGAQSDRYAEHESHFWIAVDGDGDGIREVIGDSPAVDVAPGAPAGLLLTLPSTARPGQWVRLTLAVLDAGGNAGLELAGEFVLEDVSPGLEAPARITLALGDGGRKHVDVRAAAPGIYRLAVRGPEGLRAESNPLVVESTGARVLWADLHGHSNFSDGTGTPEDYFRYARDVAALDVAVLTDHDHWGMRFLDQHPELWEEIRAQTRRFHEPGRFVTMLGYEWTSWIHGHRHVVYFSDEGEIHSSMNPATDDPRELWDALRGRDALTFAHHSAGGPIATNWAIPPDPQLEPVTEVVSVHGSSEALDAPIPIYSPVIGNFVRDVLDRGYRLGFVGSGDSHDGHPGLAQLAGTSGGLAAILSEEATRAGVLAALRARRTYATNGPRIVLRVSLGGRPMGSLLPADSVAADEELRVRVVAPVPLAKVELIRSGAIVAEVAGEGRRELALGLPVRDLRSGEYLYVRVVQEDEGAAWSSPFFVE